jgi:hypothetical protein
VDGAEARDALEAFEAEAGPTLLQLRAEYEAMLARLDGAATYLAANTAGASPADHVHLLASLRATCDTMLKCDQDNATAADSKRREAERESKKSSATAIRQLSAVAVDALGGVGSPRLLPASPSDATEASAVTRPDSPAPSDGRCEPSNLKRRVAVLPPGDGEALAAASSIMAGDASDVAVGTPDALVHGIVNDGR